MAKKRKTRRTKTVKKRKHYNSIVITFFLISCRFLFWIAKTLYFYTQKNALFFIGSLLFIMSFGFVSFNALFSQMIMQQDVFMNMKFTFAQNREKSSPLSAKEAKLSTISRDPSVDFPSHLHKNLSSHALSESTLKMQKKLAKLGFYDGPLDGIEGPKMRRAIALWKQQTIHGMQHNILPNPETDEITVLIKRSEIEMANETTKTKAVPRSKETVLEPPADIIQVQKALRIFGHQEVIVTGIEDQKTIDALKQFQKMFDLPITGKIDHTVLMKMREVGLLN
ncbi:peptidoglycan-binding protein [Bartonella vinsonii]|uniref:peptidoglycan-binding domain-containing protein n=1 Tax=Bartonella vinsonii TaxID=33047 RepID=UPI0002B6C5D7|nr:peptidoglycan-binding protein [Bartonella vinsonii]AGF75501.1 peptidoglycan-binding protein [Bartonella vinsonii subsp. berkhoffii str. Winnie]